MNKMSWRLVAAVFMLLTVACSSAHAHDLPMNSIMNAFLKVESQRVDLVVRVPLDLLRGVPFPVKDSLYDIAASGPASQLALLFLEDGFVLLENGVRVAPSSSNGRLAPASNRSFDSFDSAVRFADTSPDASTPIVYDKGSFDVHFTYAIGSPQSVFKIQTQVAADLGSGAMMTVRYLAPDDSSRALIIRSGDDPAALNPAWYHAAGGFTLLGIEHILTGIDHLLFLFCLVIPFRRWRGLVSVITAFTLAHSITLFASAFHLSPQGAWFPPLVEMCIAASIVYTALENVAGADLRRRWLVAGSFGLVHGFGFSNALGQSLQFAGSHLLLSLFAFNVGIEIGQLAVLMLMLPALALLRRVVRERIATIVLSSVVAVVGGYWVLERWQALREVEWPHLDANALVRIAVWPVIVLSILAATVILMRWIKARYRLRTRHCATPAEPIL